MICKDMQSNILIFIIHVNIVLFSFKFVIWLSRFILNYLLKLVGTPG